MKKFLFAAMLVLGACDGGEDTDTSGDTDTETADLCPDYCTDVLAACTGDNEVYADTATCMTACEGIPQTGNDGDTSGDTLQCRIYHAGAAGADPVTHCPHTGTTSATCAP